jgi:hypothetical protein
MAAIPGEQIDAAAKADASWGKYATEVDRESAREKLAAKLAPAPPQQAPAPAPAPAPSAPRRPPQPKGGGKGDDNPIGDFLKSREGRATVNTVTRGVFGVLKSILK